MFVIEDTGNSLNKPKNNPALLYPDKLSPDT